MDIETEIDRARTLHRQGNAVAAVPVYRAILEQHPDHPEALHLLGVAALQSGDPKQAIRLIGRAAELAPEKAKIQNNLGSALVALQKSAEAAPYFRRAVELDPAFDEACYNLGNALHALSKLDEAETAYRRALEINPRHASARNNVAAILQYRGHHTEAVEEFRAAVEADPSRADCRSNLVAALELTNQLDEAEAEVEELAQIAPDFPLAQLVRARVLRRAGRFDQARDLLRKAIKTNDRPALLFSLWFELSRALDRLKDYRGAFEACARAKAIRKTLPDSAHWDFHSYPAQVTAYREWFTVGRIAQRADTPSGTSPPPVFFVGFPRSGTTLMEQVLGAHPAFATTNEKTPLTRTFQEATKVIDRSVKLPDDLSALSLDHVHRLRRLFFDLAREITGDTLERRRLLDKMPMNIVELGPANWLFPDSKAIIALRDPRDVVLSCYLQQFQANRVLVQFYELENAARFYTQVMDLWLHYREILTIPWLEYRYEDLVDDFEETVARVLDFAGVPWSDEVTRFQDQARRKEIRTPSYSEVVKPISTRAVARWRNYRDQLAPILPVLEPFVREFGYDPD